ncbi:50S ribosome-binding GTPase [bacterium]|nr:50S ribosome-binding GTPase [bacterium]
MAQCGGADGACGVAACPLDTLSTKVGLKDDEPKRVVFVGCTGTGKSSLCTALTGQERKTTTFKMGKGGKSETACSSVEELHWLGDPELPTFKCIDTPGLNDSEGKDEEHIADIITKMKEMEYVSAIVMVLNGTDVRFSQSLQDVFRTFQEAFCGDSDHGREDFYGNLIICFQRWKMDDDTVADREDEEITEESTAADINDQFREKFQVGRELACVFLDSHDRDKGRRRERSTSQRISLCLHIMRFAPD